MRASATGRAALCVALAFAGLGRASAAQGAEPPTAERAAPPEIERLEAWPELEKSAAAGAAKEVAKLRAARTPEMAASASAALAELGAGAAPELLRALSKEKDVEARARLADALAGATGAAHTRLLAREFASPSQAVRLFALERASAFPDPAIAAPAAAALAAARAALAADARRAEPDARRAAADAGRAELEAAALCAASAGDAGGLDVVLEIAERDWSARGEGVRAALEGVRGPEASARAVLALESPDSRARLAALRVLAGAGERSAAEAVAPFLDDENNQLRTAAIDALRGIVDGDPPIGDLSAFEAIELARAWKARL